MASASPLTDPTGPSIFGGLMDSPFLDKGKEPQKDKADPKAMVGFTTKPAPKRDLTPPPFQPAQGGDMPKWPDMVEQPPPPKQENTSPMEAWGSLAMLAAALGGLRSRNHATTALNAAAEALKGFHQGDEEKYKNEMEKWKVASENANRVQNYEIETYKVIMERHDKDWLNQMHAASLALQNQNVQSLIEQRKTKELNDYIKAMGQAGKAGQQAAKEQQTKFIADGIISGKQPPVLTGLYGLSGPVRAELDRQGFDLSESQLEWETAKKQVAALNSTQMVRFKALSQSVVNTINEVKDLSQKMELSGVPLYNRAELATFIQTQGNTANGQLAARYLAAVNTVKEEFANLAQGGYAPTEAVWQLANQQINADYGVKELGASLDEVQKLINYRIGAINQIGGRASQNRYTGQSGKMENVGDGQPSSFKAPATGDVMDGYRFRGGDPSKKENWEKVE